MSVACHFHLNKLSGWKVWVGHLLEIIKVDGACPQGFSFYLQLYGLPSCASVDRPVLLLSTFKLLMWAKKMAEARKWCILKPYSDYKLSLVDWVANCKDMWPVIYWLIEFLHLFLSEPEGNLDAHVDLDVKWNIQRFKPNKHTLWHIFSAFLPEIRNAQDCRLGMLSLTWERCHCPLRWFPEVCEPFERGSKLKILLFSFLGVLIDRIKRPKIVYGYILWKT